MQIEPELDNNLTREKILLPHPQSHTKLNLSMERTMERFWHEFERHGWTFAQLVTVTLEALIVLDQRHKLRLAQAAAKPILNGSHPPSQRGRSGLPGRTLFRLKAGAGKA
jgi:hypothetical protein